MSAAADARLSSKRSAERSKVHDDAVSRAVLQLIPAMVAVLAVYTPIRHHCLTDSDMGPIEEEGTERTERSSVRLALAPLTWAVVRV